MEYSIWNINARYDSTYYIESNEKYLVWDLLKIWDDIFLVKSKVKTWKKIDSNENYIWNLFSENTVLFQEFFANYWYSWYFKVFNLYVHNAKYILKYDLPKIKKQKNIKIKWIYISEYKNFEKYEDYLKMWDDSIKIINYKYFDNFKPWKWQNLFIFPDLWSINCFVSNISWKYDLLNVSWTVLSRYKFFLDVKTWKKKNIITTHAGIFQDWKNLKSIYIFEPYKWYFKNQQNPRYNTADVVKQIKFFYDVEDVYFVV